MPLHVRLKELDTRVTVLPPTSFEQEGRVGGGGRNTGTSCDDAATALKVRELLLPSSL